MFRYASSAFFVFLAFTIFSSPIEPFDSQDDTSSTYFMRTQSTFPAPKLTSALLPKGWVKDDEGEGWIANFVALGDRAKNVFTYYDLNNTGAALFPVRNSNPPLALWEVFSDPGNPSRPRGVVAAKLADVYATIIETKTTNNPSPRTIDINIYSKNGGLKWSFHYPHQTSQPFDVSSSHIGISNDGQTIAAAVYNSSAGQNEILVFTPDNALPIATYPLENGIAWQMKLSSDGNYIALGVNTKIYVVETATGNIRFIKETLAQITDSGLAISSDGSILIYGGGAPTGFLEGYFWTGASYDLQYIVPSPLTGGRYRALKISEDNSTFAAGIGKLYPLTTCRVEARNAQTGALLMGETVTSVPGPNDYQNIVMDVAISADGSRMAAALTGDEEIAPLVEEIRVYNTNSSTPIFKRNLPGSALSVDMSFSGEEIVVGSKDVHLNQSGRGGRIDSIHVPK